MTEVRCLMGINTLVILLLQHVFSVFSVGSLLPIYTPILQEPCFDFPTITSCLWMPAPDPSRLQCCCLFKGTTAIRCLPSFVIAGVQKSGTTVMFSMFLFHPNFRPPNR